MNCHIRVRSAHQGHFRAPMAECSSQFAEPPNQDGLESVKPDLQRAFSVGSARRSDRPKLLNRVTISRPDERQQFHCGQHRAVTAFPGPRS